MSSCNSLGKTVKIAQSHKKAQLSPALRQPLKSTDTFFGLFSRYPRIWMNFEIAGRAISFTLSHRLFCSHRLLFHTLKLNILTTTQEPIQSNAISL